MGAATVLLPADNRLLAALGAVLEEVATRIAAVLREVERTVAAPLSIQHALATVAPAELVEGRKTGRNIEVQTALVADVYGHVRAGQVADLLRGRLAGRDEVAGIAEG